MKNKLIALGLIATMLGSVGCKKFLNVNSDPDTPQEPSNASVFPAMLAGIPRGFQYDARYVGKYDQIWLSNANVNADTYDRHGYAAGSDNTGDIWRQTYYGLGKNLDYMIEQGIRKQQYDYVGAALALKAFMFQSATDYHGEIIFREAFKENTYYFHYDTQDVVYAGVDSITRLAVDYLSRTDYTKTLALSDYVYKGDVNLWKKFCYGILARNFHRYSNKANYVSAHYADSVMKYTNPAIGMASVSDDFNVPFDATLNDNTNFFGPYRDNLSAFRQSNFIVKLLDGTTLAGSNAVFNNRDPRIKHMLSASYDTTNGNGGYRGVDPGIGDPYSALLAPTSYAVNSTNWINSRKKVSTLWGDSTQANPSPGVFSDAVGKFLFKNKSVMPVMTYAEMQFLRAEAAFKMGDKPTAFTAYRAGINGHFDFINRNYGTYRGPAPSIYNGTAITTAERTTYLGSASVKQDPTSLTISDIMLQKYIALWGWGWVETWVDLRRYQYNVITDPATTLPVYRNFQLPNQVGSSFFPDNLNKPAYRVRPRYNSEYVWNLEELKKFGGDKADYHTYMPWFVLP
jgi:hypothetical protein